MTQDTLTIAAETANQSALDVSGLDDTDPVTVLYNYGTVPSHAKTLLGGINGLVTFTGGVAKHVPYRVAKMWQTGKRIDIGPEGQERLLPAAGGPLKVLILRDNATEADYAAALNPETANAPAVSPARLAASMRGLSAEAIIQILGPDDAIFLAQALCDALGIKTSTAFSGESSASPSSSKAASRTRR